MRRWTIREADQRGDPRAMSAQGRRPLLDRASGQAVPGNPRPKSSRFKRSEGGELEPAADQATDEPGQKSKQAVADAVELFPVGPNSGCAVVRYGLRSLNAE